MLLNMFIHFCSSFLTAFGFSILYNNPRKTIVPAGLTGAFGWSIYFLLNHYLGVIDFIATMVAAFFIAFASQSLARRLKTPVIIFTLPGLIPLVPGGAAYNMMRAFVEGNTDLGFEYGVSTFLTAGALALGLSINGALFQLFTTRSLTKVGRKYVP